MLNGACPTARALGAMALYGAADRSMAPDPGPYLPLAGELYQTPPWGYGGPSFLHSWRVEATAARASFTLLSGGA